MHSKPFVVVASVLALLITVACGDNRAPSAPTPSNSTPSQPAPNPPSPSPTPNPPAPTPTPNPPSPTPTPNPPQPNPPQPNPPTPGPVEAIVFTPDTTSPGSRSYSLQPAGMVGDDYYVAVNMTDFGQDAVNMVRAEITFDPAVVTAVSYSAAESWLKTFGNVAFKVTTVGTNKVRIQADIDSSSVGASGSGQILRIRFRKVSPGSSRLELMNARAYDAGFNDSLASTHGGTITVK